MLISWSKHYALTNLSDWLSKFTERVNTYIEFKSFKLVFYIYNDASGLYIYIIKSSKT